MKRCPHCSKPVPQGLVTCGSKDCIRKARTSKSSMRLRSQTVGVRFVPPDYSPGFRCAACGEPTDRGQYRTHCRKHAYLGRWSSHRAQCTENEKTFKLGNLKKQWREQQIQEAAEKFRKMTMK